MRPHKERELEETTGTNLLFKTQTNLATSSVLFSVNDTGGSPPW